MKAPKNGSHRIWLTAWKILQTKNPVSRFMNCEEKIKEIDIKLISQEHRYIKAWENFFKYFLNKELESNDPRRNASLKALLWVNFGPRTISTLGIGFASLIAVFFSWQANDLLKQQNELINQEKKASYLPYLYIKPINYQLTIPNKGSNDELKFKIDQKNSNEMFATAYLPMELANLGKGAAKNVTVNVTYDQKTIIPFLESLDQISIEKQNGIISSIKYGNNTLHLLSRNDFPKVHYVLPLNEQDENPLIYLPNDYAALYSIFSWVKANKIVDIDKIPKFPNALIELSYSDIEEQYHLIKYEIEIFEDIRIWLAPQDNQKSEWLQLLKLRPSFKLE